MQHATEQASNNLFQCRSVKGALIGSSLLVKHATVGYSSKGEIVTIRRAGLAERGAPLAFVMAIVAP